MKNLNLGLLILLVVMAAYGITLFKGSQEVTVGSVSVTSEYYATTTGQYAIQTRGLIDLGDGTLGSVIITKAGDTEFFLLDATTSPSEIDNWSTSTNLLANFPPNVAAGTYTFDVVYHDGLYMEIRSGTQGTTTITYR